VKQGRNLVELAQEIDRAAKTKRDVVSDTRALSVNEEGALIVPNDGETDEVLAYPLTHHAGRQLATWSGVPAKYSDKMRAEAPRLYADNLNHWLHDPSGGKPVRRMVRMLDGNARAFLSDQYRRIDHENVIEMALPILQEFPDLQIHSCDVTDRKLYIKALFPSLEAEVITGDIVQAGVVISNSEIGGGSISVQQLIFRLVCSNGLISQDGTMRRNHVGRRIGEGELSSVQFSEEAMRADDRAILLLLRDTIRNAASEAGLARAVEQLQTAQTGEQIAQPVPAVETLAAVIGLNQTEQNSVLESLIRGGDMSRYGMLNAITAASQGVESYDRATELEAEGGKLLNLDPKDWHSIATAELAAV